MIKGQGNENKRIAIVSRLQRQNKIANTERYVDEKVSAFLS